MGHVGSKLARRRHGKPEVYYELAHIAVVDTRAVSFLALGEATANIHFAYSRRDGQAELANGHDSAISRLSRLDVE